MSATTDISDADDETKENFQTIAREYKKNIRERAWQIFEWKSNLASA